jgi:hypothetical protein
VVAIGTYVAAAALGFLLAYHLSSGSSAHRADTGAFGGIAGYFAAYLIAILVIAVTRARRRRA